MSRLKAGRHRATGERYACGKLKPPPPNPKVLAIRRALIGEAGDLRSAEHPLDLAWARGWIDERRHRAGQAYRQLYRQAQLGAPTGEATSNLERMERAEGVDERRLADLGAEALAEVFDRAFNRAAQPDLEARAAQGLSLWKQVNLGLSPAEQTEVFLVCVRASWPQWIVQRAAGRFGSRFEDKNRLLLNGLNKVAQALFTVGAPARKN